MTRLATRTLIAIAALSLGACAVVPAGGYYGDPVYGGGYYPSASVVVAPAPVVVRPSGYWGGGPRYGGYGARRGYGGHGGHGGYGRHY